MINSVKPGNLPAFKAKIVIDEEVRKNLKDNAKLVDNGQLKDVELFLDYLNTYGKLFTSKFPKNDEFVVGFHRSEDPDYHTPAIHVDIKYKSNSKDPKIFDVMSWTPYCNGLRFNSVFMNGIDNLYKKGLAPIQNKPRENESRIDRLNNIINYKF